MLFRLPGQRARVAFLGGLALAGFAALLIPVAIGQQGGSGGGASTAMDNETCLSCHGSKDMGAPVCNAGALRTSVHKDLKCQDCHASMTAVPHTPAMIKQKADCGTCHADAMSDYLKSAHSHVDKVAGDHPTCITCHGKGDPHAVASPKVWSRKDKVELCSSCHRQKARMERYNVDPDAVPSYEESFHGKALLQFGMTKAAGCTDCHGFHGVLSSKDPNAPTHRNHAAATCAQPGCHQGAKVNFAMSGANHLRLKVKAEPVLRYEEIFFKLLTVGTILFLLGGVALDLRKKVFSRGPAPESGRVPGLLISVSFLFLVTALLLAYLDVKGAPWSFVAAIIVMALAFAVYFASPKRARRPKGGARYQRFTVAQRAQHICLAISFTVLVITGLPLRFAGVAWLQKAHLLFGGFAGARLAHRTAAVVMIATWIWHTLYLIYRWAKAGFTLKSWTMFPSLKDLRDFIDVSKVYLGLSNEEPKYDRFQFREKFDYFAVYWGMPIMVFSGLVLWFPIYFGNQLPEIGLSVAYIAHSDEAILAFLAIATWHFYNTHFNPDHFPMSDVFYTGTLTREEMEREHPLELERAEGVSAPEPPEAPEPEPLAAPEPPSEPPAAEE